MKISEVIAELEKAIQKYGDKDLTVWDGHVSAIRLTGCVDGVSHPIDRTKVNEVSLEVMT